MFAIAGLCMACVMVLAASMAGAGTEHPRGTVYTETNSPGGNKVVVFDRFKNGTLVKRQAVATGGTGSTQSVGCGPGCPILDSQNAVVASENEKLVFAVNAGSDSVSSFREGHSGLELVDQVPSGGDMPESLALNNNVLYVLNVATANSSGTFGNIYGYRVSGDGHLTPIGSSQALPDASLPDHSGDARAIGFKPNGKVIVVTELSGGFPFSTGPPGRIVTFVVGSHGQAAAGVSHASSDLLPFGFAFDSSDHLVVSNIHDLALHAIGSVSSYTVSNSGDVTPINTVSSGGALPCWVAISKDNKVAYVVNTGAGADPARTTQFRLGPNGTLTPQGAPAEHTGDFAQTDIDMSRGGRYVYVLAPSVGPGPPSHIDIWRRHHDGSLTYIGATPADPDMGVGVTGLAAN
jgi:6-phosphogluconolactonase (cycloisomerase 2 family)